MCICMYVCREWVCVCINGFVFSCTVYRCLYVFDTHTHTYTHTHTIYIYIYLYIISCMPQRFHTHTHTLYIYIYIYTHTHTSCTPQRFHTRVHYPLIAPNHETDRRAILARISISPVNGIFIFNGTHTCLQNGFSPAIFMIF